MTTREDRGWYLIVLDIASAQFPRFLVNVIDRYRSETIDGLIAGLGCLTMEGFVEI